MAGDGDDDFMNIGPPVALPALSKLPVFLDLAGRRAVLAGDTPGLAWKAELIAAAGADVLILAPAPSEELRALMARGSAAGRLELEQRAWQPADLEGAAIAVADLPTVSDAAAFKAAGEAAGVIVNTVDKGATCDFYFGAIVSRSPIVIGISTDGAAPILGQAIRRATEIAVPDWLEGWARFARDIRGEVMARLAPGYQRRVFWEAFAGLAMAGALDESMKAEIRSGISDLAARLPELKGALSEIVAPASSDDLTLGDVKRLQSADVLIEEEGIAPAIRVFYRREATRLRPGRQGVPGEIAVDEMETGLAALVAEGRRVVVIRTASKGASGRPHEASNGRNLP